MQAAPVKRTYSKLPVWIVEDHHDVVPHIYRAIASRHIPIKDLKMVHLDSHPDLLIPVSMLAQTVFDKESLFSELSIENWIMPMVYAGHVSYVAWLHPHWAQQIREGEHHMHVGRDTSTGTIRVTSRDDYFLSDALYVPAAQLEDAKSLRLSVVRVDPAEPPETNHTEIESGGSKRSRPGRSESCSDVPQPEGGSSASGTSGAARSAQSHSRPADGDKVPAAQALLRVLSPDDPYILDVDLDFFSCKNPFKEMFTQEEYSVLKELYGFVRPAEDAGEEELCECVERRTRQLEDLEGAFADLLEDDAQSNVEHWAAKLGMKSFTTLVSSLRSRTESPDYEMVHQAGLTCDYSELPHHVSTRAEIQQLLRGVRLVLRALPKPTIVTVSRSSLDEYCPPGQVDLIQGGVLNILETLFGPLDVHQECEGASGERSSACS